MPRKDYRPDHANLGGSNKMLGVVEAAAYLHVPEKSLRNYWQKWGVPSYKIGQRRLFRERDLNLWIESKRVA